MASQPIGAIGGVDARGVAGAVDRAALERARDRARKPVVLDVGEVVVVDGLGAQGFLRAGHRHIEHAVHGWLPVGLADVHDGLGDLVSRA